MNFGKSGGVPALDERKNIDYYAVLGIDSRATKDEIEKAYRELARGSHSDKVRGREAQVNMRKFNRKFCYLLLL